MKHLLLCLLGWLFLFGSLTGQSGTHALILKIIPTDAHVRIDGKDYDLGAEKAPGILTVQLTDGPHEITIWHPYFEDHTETVVMAGANQKYYHGLKVQRKAYEDFKVSLEPYKKVLTKKYVAGIAANVIGWAATMYYDGGEERRLITSYNNGRETYYATFDPASLPDIRAEYENTADEIASMQESKNLRRTFGIPLMTGVSAFTVYYLRKQTRAFNQRKNSYEVGQPFTLSLSELSVTSASASLTFKF